MRFFSILLLFVNITSAQITLILTDGKRISGTQISENANFVVIDAGGSQLSVLKSLIDTIVPGTEPADLASSAAEADITNGSTVADPSPAIADSPGTAGATLTSANVKPVSAPRPPKPMTVTRATRLSLEALLEKPDAIESLDLSYQNLDALSGQIVFFKNLKRLDLKGNNLEKLPPEIGDLTRLTELDLRLNRISQLPAEISNLTGLAVLLLTGNDFTARGLAELRSLLPFTRVIASPSGLLRSKKDRPRPIAADDRATLDSLQQRCSMGDAGACRQLGSFWEELSDNERAALAYEEGCRSDSRDTSDAALTCCVEAAEFFNEFIRDRETAQSLYDHVCTMESHHAETACERADRLRRRK
jgi:hypothetical protein